MSSYWRIVPTSSPLASPLGLSDMYLPTTAHRFFRDRYLDRVFDASPSTTHAELEQKFDGIYKKHWEDFDKVVNDSFGVKMQWDRDAGIEARGKSTGPATGTRADAVSKPSQGFEVALDLKGFTSEEISVKISGNTLRVEAKHEKTDGGSNVLRSYTREFVLPADVDLDALKSSLNAQGMLSLTAPGRGSERAIPIDVAAKK